MSAGLDSSKSSSAEERWERLGEMIFGMPSSKEPSSKGLMFSDSSDSTISSLSSSVLRAPVPRRHPRRYDPTSDGSSSISFKDSLSDVSEDRLRESSQVSLKNRSAVREFRKIIKHPHIKAHPTDWKKRFSPRLDSPIQEIAQNIYQTMETQKGRTLNLSKKEGKKENIHPSNVSFEHFHNLYEEGRKLRFNRYRTALEYQLQSFEYRDISALMNKVKSDEGTFSEEMLLIVGSPSFLLECAVKANYWEDISLFVREGGELKDFGSVASGFRYDKEWVSIYRDAYHAKHGVFPNQQGSSSAAIL